MKNTIKRVHALEILDSRGEPTVEVTVFLDSGIRGSASVPSGASTGRFEAFELRDNDAKRYHGKGVLKAVANVNKEINDRIIGFDATEQCAIDDALVALDGTDNKHRLGANAILGVSLAVARAASIAADTPLFRYLRGLTEYSSKEFTLPTPLINVINGGKHASSNLDIQEFWIIPHRTKTFREKVRQGSQIFHTLGGIFEKQGLDTDLGNEGGYAPNFTSHDQVFAFLMHAIEMSGWKAGVDVSLGIDAGSSVFFDTDTEKYKLSLEHREFSTEEIINYYKDLLRRYPILALEDPLAEEQWTAWQKFTDELKRVKPDLRLIGDDLFVTNPARLQKGIDLSVANSILIKLNQIGTLSETLDCIMLAKKNGYATAISHRSGETTDSFIADLAVAVNSEFIKTGSIARGERTVKYNRLLEIEEELHG